MSKKLVYEDPIPDKILKLLVSDSDEDNILGITLLKSKYRQWKYRLESCCIYSGNYEETQKIREKYFHEVNYLKVITKWEKL